MKFFTNKNITQKIVIALVIVVVFNFFVPVPSRAGFGGDLLKELVKLFVALGDVVNGMFNHFILGTTEIYGSVIFDYDSEILKKNLENEESSLHAGEFDEKKYVKAPIPDGFEFEAQGWIFDKLQVPNIMYCPENIFANKIALLDVNFINPHDYNPVEYTERRDCNRK